MKKFKNVILTSVLVSILSLSTACSGCGNDIKVDPEDMVSTEIKTEELSTEYATIVPTTETDILNELNSAGETVNEMVTDIGNAALKAARAMQP